MTRVSAKMYSTSVPLELPAKSALPENTASWKSAIQLNLALLKFVAPLNLAPLKSAILYLSPNVVLLKSAISPNEARKKSSSSGKTKARNLSP